MGKEPGFYFYVQDWLADPAVRACSPATRGLWIDALCFMWKAPTRGILEGTIPDLARILGITPGACKEFIGELERTGAADVERGKKGNVNLDDQMCKRHGVTPRSKKVTLKNRRMFREESARKSHNIRQKRYREKSDGQSDGQSDATVTPPSSLSSSSPPKAPPVGVTANGQQLPHPADDPETRRAVKEMTDQCLANLAK